MFLNSVSGFTKHRTTINEKMLTIDEKVLTDQKKPDSLLLYQKIGDAVIFNTSLFCTYNKFTQDFEREKRDFVCYCKDT